MEQDKKGLFIQAIGKFLLGVVLLGLLIFLPAGSLSYWQGWLLLGILFVPVFVAGLVMMAYIPLIAKRIRNEEKVLEDGLQGYRDYKTRVKYKVIPFIW